jgi:hypothetical protein
VYLLICTLKDLCELEVHLPISIFSRIVHSRNNIHILSEALRSTSSPSIDPIPAMRAGRDFRSFSRQRLRTASYKEAVISIASPHTKTVNIWSHLLGTTWFGYSAVRFAVTCTGPLTQDTLVILVYLVATALCFACSTLYHLFADHVWESSWLRLDHFGVVCAIWASSISFILRGSLLGIGA